MIERYYVTPQGHVQDRRQQQGVVYAGGGRQVFRARAHIRRGPDGALAERRCTSDRRYARPDSACVREHRQSSRKCRRDFRRCRANGDLHDRYRRVLSGLRRALQVFQEPLPTSTLLGVAKLGMPGMLVEIEVEAMMDASRLKIKQ